MDKEDFIIHAMKLLQTLLDKQEEGVATTILTEQGVQEHEIPSVLHTISNISRCSI